jgi:hypothetical protein
MAEFSWAAAGDVGLGLLGGLTKGLSGMAASSAAKANAEAQNLIREGQNEVERSKRSLAATVRGINNDRLLRAAGKQLDVLTANAVRMSESYTKGNFEQSIKDAESMGAASLRAAASGLGGSSVAAIGQVTQLAQARQAQYRQEAQSDQLYDATQATVDVLGNALRQTSTAPLTASMQYGMNSINQSGSLAGALLEGLLAKDKRASLQTLLGSLAGDEPRAKPTLEVAGGASVPFEFEGAEAFPVTDSVVTPTDLGQLGGGPYVDRSDRLLLNATLK